MELKYGCNPHQQAKVDGLDPCLTVVNGNPSFINFLDALGSWQLVRELTSTLDLCAAASFKHTSPAGVAIAHDPTLAYMRARSSDRKSSFGDFIAISGLVDRPLAKYIKSQVSDGIIAGAYTDEALDILKKKKNGSYVIFQIDPEYQGPSTETREVMGFCFTQQTNQTPVTKVLFENVVTKRKEIPDDVLRTLQVATITLKYTQSNSVCIAYDNHVIGVGAGQQSRIDCVSLACQKANQWFDTEFLLPPCTELTPIDEICLASDAFFPFKDSIEVAAGAGISYISQPGGSIRDQEVTDTANRYGMLMCHTGLRCFTH